MKQLVMWCKHAVGDLLYVEYSKIFFLHFNDISQKQLFFYLLNFFFKWELHYLSKLLINLTAFLTVLMLIGEREAPFFVFSKMGRPIYFSAHVWKAGSKH